MIKVAKILYSGGLCPYQCEFLTENHGRGYLRYRGGILSFGVNVKDGETVPKPYLFSEKIGDDYDGGPNDALFRHQISRLIEFPLDFSFESYYSGDNEQDYQV